MVCLTHRVLTASVRRVQGGFTGEVSGRGVYLTVLVVPSLKIPVAVFPLPQASSWRRALLSTNNVTFI